MYTNMDKQDPEVQAWQRANRWTVKREWEGTANGDAGASQKSHSLKSLAWQILEQSSGPSQYSAGRKQLEETIKGADTWTYFNQ